MRKRGSSLGGWGLQNLNPNPAGKISNLTSAYFSDGLKLNHKRDDDK